MTIIVFWHEFPKGLVGNKSALMHVVALRQAGDKPLLKPLMTQITDAYMHLQASFCWHLPPLLTQKPINVSSMKKVLLTMCWKKC